MNAVQLDMRTTKEAKRKTSKPVELDERLCLRRKACSWKRRRRKRQIYHRNLLKDSGWNRDPSTQMTTTMMRSSPRNHRTIEQPNDSTTIDAYSLGSYYQTCKNL